MMLLLLCYGEGGTVYDCPLCRGKQVRSDILGVYGLFSIHISSSSTQQT